MLIRRATLDDLEELVRLRLEFLREVGNLKGGEGTAALAEAIRRYLLEKMPREEFMAWVAEVDGRIVGVSGLVFFEKLPAVGNPSGREAYVMNMYTIPEWRGKGVATALLRAIIEFVKGTEVKRIWLRATEEGRPVYEKAGFSPATSYMELTW